MARPKSANHELQREAILDVAAQAFARHGYVAASMNDIAQACGTSKARLYHYYSSKDAMLFDLLDRYTQRLLVIVGETDARAQRQNLNDQEALHDLIRAFLQEYERSATRHMALLNDAKHLGSEQHELILNRQRDVVSAFTRFLKRAYPTRVKGSHETPITMMVFGMMNWTFTWLRSDGPMSYRDFANEVIEMMERGLGAQTKDRSTLPIH